MNYLILNNAYMSTCSGTFEKQKRQRRRGETSRKVLMSILWQICPLQGKVSKKKSEIAFTSLQLTNYASNSDYDDRSGKFLMRHRANSMIELCLTSTSYSPDVSFVDSFVLPRRRWQVYVKPVCHFSF